jgi:hypothetical protein
MTWQDRLRAAASESEVVGIVRDYVATLTPGDVERLPEPCRPGKFFDANDVTSFACTLVRHDCAVDAATARLVRKMVKFFTEASFRLSQFTAGAIADNHDSQKSA